MWIHDQNTSIARDVNEKFGVPEMEVTNEVFEKLCVRADGTIGLEWPNVNNFDYDITARKVSIKIDGFNIFENLNIDFILLKISSLFSGFSSTASISGFEFNISSILSFSISLLISAMLTDDKLNLSIIRLIFGASCSLTIISTSPSLSGCFLSIRAVYKTPYFFASV